MKIDRDNRADASNVTKGILWMLASAIGFAAMNSMVMLSGDLPIFQKMFFRNFIAMLISYFAMRRGGIGLRPEKGNECHMFLRSLTGLLGMIGNYYALDRMLLSDVTVIVKLSPFFTLMFSALILKETFKPQQLLFMIVAFIGGVLVAKPEMNFTAMLPVMAAFMTAVASGVSYTYVRSLQQHGEDKNRIIFTFSAISCLFCVPFFIAGFTPMTWRQLACLILVGVFASVGQFGMTNAYRYAASRELSTADYSQVFFAAVLGYFLFGQLPDRYSVIGYFIIITAVLGNSIYSASLEEKKKRKELSAGAS